MTNTNRSPGSGYQGDLFSNVPLVTTRLVREDTLPWPRTQLASPEDAAAHSLSIEGAESTGNAGVGPGSKA